MEQQTVSEGIAEGDELRDVDNQNVLVVTDKSVGGCTVQVWSENGRLQNTRQMAEDTLQDALDDNELCRL